MEPGPPSVAMWAPQTLGDRDRWWKWYKDVLQTKGPDGIILERNSQRYPGRSTKDNDEQLIHIGCVRLLHQMYPEFVMPKMDVQTVAKILAEEVFTRF